MSYLPEEIILVICELHLNNLKNDIVKCHRLRLVNKLWKDHIDRYMEKKGFWRNRYIQIRAINYEPYRRMARCHNIDFKMQCRQILSWYNVKIWSALFHIQLHICNYNLEKIIHGFGPSYFPNSPIAEFDTLALPDDANFLCLNNTVAYLSMVHKLNYPSGNIVKLEKNGSNIFIVQTSKIWIELQYNRTNKCSLKNMIWKRNITEIIPFSATTTSQYLALSNSNEMKILCLESKEVFEWHNSHA